jgi:hypothetical protein
VNETTTPQTTDPERPPEGGDERYPFRRHRRFRRLRPVVLRPMGGPPVFGRMEVVAESGALLRCPRCFEVGERLDLTICLAGAVIPAKARVASVEPVDGAGDCAVGVEFRYLGDGGADLLRSVIERRD